MDKFTNISMPCPLKYHCTKWKINLHQILVIVKVKCVHYPFLSLQLNCLEIPKIALPNLHDAGSAINHRRYLYLHWLLLVLNILPIYFLSFFELETFGQNMDPLFKFSWSIRKHGVLMWILNCEVTKSFVFFKNEDQIILLQ